jgi:ATPase subunit of ABC transporter with duplicated ATPase domains
MKTRRLLATLLIAGAFALPVTSKNAIVNASNVTIVSIDAHSLVVSRTIKGKTELLRFVLNANTVLKGKLDVGSKVTVHYTTQSNLNTATSVQSREPNPPPRDARLPK